MDEAAFEVQVKRMKLEESINQSMLQLGAADLKELKALSNNTFLRLQLNARSVKTRIRQRLRERKFELERLERCYRNALNGKFGCLQLPLVMLTFDRPTFIHEPHLLCEET